MAIEDGQGVYRDFDTNFRRSINFGYIVIPENEDRLGFIERCLRLEQFSIYVEGGGVMHNCMITKSALRDLSFPVEGDTLGSAVTFFAEPDTGQLIIIGVISKGDQTELNKDEVITFKKTKNGNYALFTIDGNGRINIDIVGSTSGGSLNINVINSSYTSEVKVYVKGDISLYTEGNTEITAIDGNIDLITNQNVTVTANKEVNIQSALTKVHAANEAMVRGNELEANLIKTNEVVEAIQNSLLNWSPIPKDGGAALKVMVVSNLSGKSVGTWDKIKSEKSFLE